LALWPFKLHHGCGLGTDCWSQGPSFAKLGIPEIDNESRATNNRIKVAISISSNNPRVIIAPDVYEYDGLFQYLAGSWAPRPPLGNWTPIQDLLTTLLNSR
jgi:hypothetical protein